MSKRTSHPTRQRAGRGIPAVTITAVLAGSGIAAAATTVGLGRPTGFTARFSTRQAGAPSGLVLRTAGRPPAAGVTVPPAVRQTVAFPAGTSLRLAALPQCDASDAAIAAQGAEGACPSRSRVGTGSADGILNGKPVHFDIGIYAVHGHLDFAAEQNGRPLKQAFLGVARGSRLELTVPTLNGMIAPTGFAARIPAGDAATPWLRTPPRCPPSSHWTVTGHFQGFSAAAAPSHAVTPAQTLTAAAPCHG
ncbi:MAG: hypothetical protein ACXVRM_04970 [Solirubrobacteraceae bacterium]